MRDYGLIIGLTALAVVLVVLNIWLAFGEGWKAREVVGVVERAAAKLPLPQPNTTDESVVFVGDIMLARSVERSAERLGIDYLFEGVLDLFSSKAVVGNFEASVPEIHEPTPNFTFQFSVPTWTLNALAKAGITHLSLANNHALDHGVSGYRNTLAELAKRDLVAFGHPSAIATSSVTYIEANNTKIGVVAISAVFSYPKESSWKPVVDMMASSSDLQIVYIHWGEEYELVHNIWQENFAKSLIDSGVDIVVGHHPHVTQDVWRYGNGLVFYSLGNFIFDQYWNDDVRSGLALKLLMRDDSWWVDILPVESINVRLQPREMLGRERELFLIGLADRSDPSMRAEITSGRLPLQF